MTEKKGIFTRLEEWSLDKKNPVLAGLLFLPILLLDIILVPIEIIQEIYWMRNKEGKKCSRKRG